jgi:regulator of replication initiation timing
MKVKRKQLLEQIRDLGTENELLISNRATLMKHIGEHVAEKNSLKAEIATLCDKINYMKSEEYASAQSQRAINMYDFICQIATRCGDKIMELDDEY